MTMKELGMRVESIYSLEIAGMQVTTCGYRVELNCFESFKTVYQFRMATLLIEIFCS